MPHKYMLVCWNLNWYSHCEKQYGGSANIWNTNTVWFNHFNSGYLKKMKHYLEKKNIYTVMFIAALFIITKTWKYPKLLPNKEANPAIWHNGDGSWGYYTKGNKSDIDKYCMI